MIHIVLVEPDIPQNTGNIARLCAATNSCLHLVGPLGFSLDEKYLKRAGMDYWNLAEIKQWKDWNNFEPQLANSNFYLLTTKTKKSYWDITFKDNDYLIFGRESKGLPESLLQKYPDHCLTIPMPNPKARSLNLATSVGIVLYDAIKKSV